MNIALIGYRGTGKTSIGKLMAEELWKDFVDTDALVRKRFGNRTIREIWDTEGEAAFRQAECEVVKQLLEKSNQIIALGGGTVMQPAAREAITQAKDLKVIYLKCDPAVLHQRIHADPQSAAERPALTPQGGGIEEIRAVLAEREPVYQSIATKTFDVSHAGLQDCVGYIIRLCL